MYNSFLSKLVLLVFSTIMVTSIYSQTEGKTKIHITKNEDGVVTEYNEEFDMNNEQSIQDVLIELGLLDEFGKLKEGQTFEISIKKIDESAEFKDFLIDINSEATYFEKTPYLGVILKNSHDCNNTCTENSDSNKELKGAFVGEVLKGTSAEAAGLKNCDIIFNIDKKDIESIDDLISIIGEKNIGDEIRIAYYRNGKKEKTKAILGQRENQELFEYMFLGDENHRSDYERFDILSSPENELQKNEIWFDNGDFELEKSPFLGVTPSCENSDLPGASISTVVDGSSAELIGIMKGDRITVFNGKSVNDFDELASEIGKTEPNSEISLELIRDGKKKKLKGQIGMKEYSNCDDLKIFHDFKGVDEEGSLFYDYEFNFDEDDMKNMMEELQMEIEKNIENLELEKIALNEFVREMENNSESLTIRIEVETVSDIDVEQINKGADTGFTNANDLELDRISFFPNPSNGIVTLEFELSSTLPVQLIILEQNGSQIYSENIKNFEGIYSNTIDISKHADGSYFLLISQEGKSYCKKLLKNQ